MCCFPSPATAASSKSMEEFCFPEYIFKPDAIVPEGKRPPPSCPVIVFINSRSGGQLGGALLQTYADLLNSWQVFDLTEEAPDKVLHSLYLNLETRKISGDELAKKIYKSLKLIVAGGDGTAGWLLSVVSDLKLTRPPPIATMPLGTGNNLHFAFGWGKKNPGTDRQSVKVFLDQVKNAKELKIDRMGIAPSVVDFGITSAWEWMLKYLMLSILKGSCIQKNLKNSYLTRLTFFSQFRGFDAVVSAKQLRLMEAISIRKFEFIIF